MTDKELTDLFEASWATHGDRALRFGRLVETAVKAQRLDVGDLVIDLYGRQAVVQSIHLNAQVCLAHCRTMTPEQWLIEQEMPITESEKAERWITADCVEGGSIWSPESRLQRKAV